MKKLLVILGIVGFVYLVISTLVFPDRGTKGIIDDVANAMKYKDTLVPKPGVESEVLKTPIHKPQDYGFAEKSSGNIIFMFSRDVSGSYPEDAKKATDAIIQHAIGFFGDSFAWGLELWRFGSKPWRVGGPAYNATDRDLLIADWNNDSRIYKGYIISPQEKRAAESGDVDEYGRRWYALSKNALQPADDRYTDILGIAETMLSYALPRVKAGDIVQIDIMTDMLNDPAPNTRTDEAERLMRERISALLDSVVKAGVTDRLRIHYFMARDVETKDESKIAYAVNLFAAYPNFQKIVAQNWVDVEQKMISMHKSMVGSYGFGILPLGLSFLDQTVIIMEDIPFLIHGLKMGQFKAELAWADTLHIGQPIPWYVKDILSNSVSLKNGSNYALASGPITIRLESMDPSVIMPNSEFVFSLSPVNAPIALMKKNVSFSFSTENRSFYEKWGLLMVILFFGAGFLAVVVILFIMFRYLRRVVANSKAKRVQTVLQSTEEVLTRDNSVTGSVMGPDRTPMIFANMDPHETVEFGPFTLSKQNGTTYVCANEENCFMRYQDNSYQITEVAIPSLITALPSSAEVSDVDFVHKKSIFVPKEKSAAHKKTTDEFDLESIIGPADSFDATETTIEEIYTYRFQ